MQVVPAINCSDFLCVKKYFNQIAEFSDLAHIDVSDGKFGSVRSWNEPKRIGEIVNLAPNLNLEVHLMTENPLTSIREWFQPNVKKIIVHVERLDREKLREILEIMPEGVALGLAFNPETPVEDAELFLDDVDFVLCLAVSPGASGQKFQSNVIKKIEEIRNFGHNVTIEVDGGIDLKIARTVKEAGADIIVSASYIWNSIDPRGAYQDLTDV